MAIFLEKECVIRGQMNLKTGKTPRVTEGQDYIWITTDPCQLDASKILLFLTILQPPSLLYNAQKKGFLSKIRHA